MMTELREKIADEIDRYRYLGDGEARRSLEIADRILAIPELAEALSFVKALNTPGAIQITLGPSMLNDGHR